MKDVRNKQLRNKLDKLGIKDVVLNFDNGFVAIWSEDDLTDTIFHYADNTIETRAFSDFSINEWVDMIKDIFDEGLDSYEHRHGFDDNVIVIKNLKDTNLSREAVIESMAKDMKYSESEHSQIGIFWWDRNENELFGINKEDAEHIPFVQSSDGDKIRSYGKLHKDIWAKEQRRGKSKFQGDYTLVPRGRVSQYLDKGFVVFVGDWIDDYPQAKKEIIDEFELSKDVKFIKDEHWNIGHGWSDELI